MGFYRGIHYYFLFLLKNIDCGYSLEPHRWGGSNEYPQSMFWAEIWKKYWNFLFEHFHFLMVIFSIYLNRRVFVIIYKGFKQTKYYKRLLLLRFVPKNNLTNLQLYEIVIMNITVYRKVFITKTYLYNFYPLKPHFHIVKLGFTGVYIIFLFLLKNIDCGYSLEPPRFEQK